MLNKKLWEVVNKSISPEPEDKRFDKDSFFEVFIFEAYSNRQLEKKYLARLEEVTKVTNDPYIDRILIFIAREMKKRYRSGKVHFYSWNIFSMFRSRDKIAKLEANKESAQQNAKQSFRSDKLPFILYVLGAIPWAYIGLVNHDMAPWLAFCGTIIIIIGFALHLYEYLRPRILFPILIIVALCLLWLTFFLQGGK